MKQTLSSCKKTIRLVMLLLFILGIAGSIANARAQETIVVNSASSNVTLSVHIAFLENVTALSNSTLSLDSSNASEARVVNSFQSAIQRVVPRATVDSSTFRFNANVRQQHRNSSTWIISENLTFTVSSVASSRPGVSSYDLSFVTLNMSDSLKFGGFEFNNIGPAYLIGPISSQGSGVTFYLDRGLVRGGPYLNTVIPGLTTQGFGLFDFSWVPKISEWTNTYKPLDTSSTWTLSPGKDRPGLPYNLTIGVKSPEGTLLFVKAAYYNLDFQLTAPARAVASGSTISFNVPSSNDFVMPTIIAAAIAVGAVSFLAEKMVVKPKGQIRKKRKG